MKNTFLLAVFVVLSTAAFAFNQPTELRGITTVNVMVADLPDVLSANGVGKDALASALEEALRAAGLTVLSQGEYADTVPTVSLEVRAIKPPDGRIYAADIVLDCLDNVSSRRTAGVFTAIIWSKNVLALLGAVDQGRIMDGEKKLIEMFLGDYAQANQK